MIIESIQSVSIFVLCLTLSGCRSHETVMYKSPECVYENDSFTILEIPGQKLDIKTCLSKEFQDSLNPIDKSKLSKHAISEITNYIGRHRHIKTQWSACKFGHFLLVFVHEEGVADGGYEFIYDQNSKHIVGSFSTGYRG